MRFESFARAFGRDPAFGGLAVAIFERVDSTQLLARRLADLSAESPPIALVAWEQTAGRGRGGRPWASPAGQGVYASLLTRLPRAADLTVTALALPVILCRVVDRHLDRRCRLKWPNDLLVGGRKLGGVLIDAVSSGGGSTRVVAGFGLNYGAPGAPPPDPGAATLLDASSRPPTLAALAAELVAATAAGLAALPQPAAAAAEFRRRCVHRTGDRMVLRTPGGDRAGRFRCVDDQGRLHLESEGEVLRLAAGEVVEG